MKLNCVLLFAVMVPTLVVAHEMRPAIGTATISRDGSFEVLISLNLEAVMAGVEPDHSDTEDSAKSTVYEELRALPPDVLRAKFNAFAPRFARAVLLGPSEGETEPLDVTGLMVPVVGDLAAPRISEVTLKGKLPPETDQVVWSFDPAFADSVIRLRMAGEVELFHSQYVSGAKSTAIPLDTDLQRSMASVFFEYLQLGFIHIIPKGLDHILFIVGLFLLSTRRSVLLWQITAFTAAHTITLALGSLGIIRLSPAIVEPLIALSIVYIAFENLMTTRMTAWRTLIIFSFGLLHGLGFAGILSQFGLSTVGFVNGLVAFNVGVELGQLSVIAASFLLVGWAMKLPDYRQFVVRPGSLVIALIAVYWSIERIVV